MEAEAYFSIYKKVFDWNMVFQEKVLEDTFDSLEGFYPNDSEKEVCVAFAISRLYDPYKYGDNLDTTLLKTIWEDSLWMRGFLGIWQDNVIYNEVTGHKIVEFLTKTQDFDWKELMEDRMLEPYRSNFTYPGSIEHLLSGEPHPPLHKNLFSREIEKMVF